MNFAILKNLKNPTYLFVMMGVSFLLFDLNYYFMSQLPGHENLQCVIGAGLNFGNILFSILISLFSGILVAGFLEAHKRRHGKFAADSIAGSIGGIGILFGSLTVFCTLCTLPVISIFGFAIGLSFFTTYDLVFKIISLIMLLIGLYLINQQLNDDCKICAR